MVKNLQEKYKVIIFEDWDYDSIEQREVFLVSSDFNMEEEKQRWIDETGTPVKWKNQFTSGLSKRPRSSISFHKWMSRHYITLEFQVLDWEE